MAGAAHHEHHLPTSGRALNAISLSATLHCLTGCAIGEIVGMVVAHDTFLSFVIDLSIHILHHPGTDGAASPGSSTGDRWKRASR